MKGRNATHVTLEGGQRIYVSGGNKKELRNKVNHVIRTGARMNRFCSADSTFEEYARTWFEVYKAPQLSASSRELVIGFLNNHIIPHFEGMRLRDIQPIHVKTLFNDLEDGNYSHSSQDKVRQYLSGIFNTAIENHLIDSSPLVKSIKATGALAEEEEPLTREESKALLEAVKGTRAYPFCYIALSTGLRRGEILALKWEDIHGDYIEVTHNKAFPGGVNDAPVTTKLKTKASKRRIPISKGLANLMQGLRLVGDSEFVLSMEDGGSYTLSAFRRMWDIVNDRSPVKCHPHQLRHTFATRMFEAGADIKEVQYLMGHSTPTVTMQIYVHYDKKSREAETANKVRDALADL